MMEELHSQGKTVEQIAECLKHVPLHPRTISAIESAHDLGYVFIICLFYLYIVTSMKLLLLLIIFVVISGVT